MKTSHIAGMIALAATIALSATLTRAQSSTVPTSGPAENGNIAWFLQGSFQDPGGGTEVAADGTVSILPRGNRTPAAYLAACSDDIKQICGGQTGFAVQGCLNTNKDKLSGSCKAAMAAQAAASGDVPNCSHSPVCGNRMTNGAVGPQQGGGAGHTGNAPNGRRPWGTHTHIPTLRLPAPVACRRWLWIQKAISGPSNAVPPARRSCMSTGQTISSSAPLAKT